MEDNSAEVVSDSFAETVFNEDVSSETSSDEGLDSWDDADTYEAPAAETQEESSEELNVEDSSEGTEPEDRPTEQSETEASENSEESKGEGEEGEESSEETPFEMPEELAEHGLTVSEEGEVGFTYKADGENHFISLKDVKAHEAGQVAWDRRFQELDSDRQQHSKEVQEVEGYINNFAEKLQQNDSLGALQYMGEFSGIPPYQVKRQLLEQLRPEFERLSQMSAIELQSEYNTEENEYLKQSLESKQVADEQRQVQQTLDSQIASVREAHEITDSEWNQAITYLQEHENALREENPNLIMDADFVADFVQDNRAYNRAETAFRAADVNLSEEQSSDILDFLHEAAYRNPDFDQNDLVDLVKKAQETAIESKVSKDLKTRIKKHGSKPGTKPEVKNEITSEEQSVLDDIWG